MDLGQTRDKIKRMATYDPNVFAIRVSGCGQGAYECIDEEKEKLLKRIINHKDGKRTRESVTQWMKKYNQGGSAADFELMCRGGKITKKAVETVTTAAKDRSRKDQLRSKVGQLIMKSISTYVHTTTMGSNLTEITDEATRQQSPKLLQGTGLFLVFGNFTSLHQGSSKKRSVTHV
jgi:hypothetical protein